MEKRVLYGIVAVVVVIVVIVAAAAVILYKPPTTKVSPTAPTLVSVTPSTQLTTVGTSIQFTASVSGNVTSVSWNFGDGTTGTGLSVTHAYTEPGSYLVFVNASGPSGYANNLKALIPISISPGSVSPLIASEITQPVLTLNTTLNTNAPIYSVNTTAEFLESYLQPPTATNWTIGYYVMNFGDGSPITITPVYYNFSSGVFESNLLSHIFTRGGFYVVNFTVVTYNESLFSSSIVTNNTTSIQYLPLSDYSHVISSNQHYEVSYIRTVYVAMPQEQVGIQKAPVSTQTSQVINVAEVAPGGPYSFDPAVDYDIVGFEDIENVYETLLQYNGSSTSNEFPMVATEIPTVANGGISPNYLNYTFQIRSGLKFSNGDPLNVWDVYVSYVRALLFVQGSPGTADWIIAQDLLPEGGFASGLFTNGTALYDNITRAITYNNATQTITFHLLKPDPAFLDYVADPEGGGIMDWNWLVQHGAGIQFTPAGFLNYTLFSNEGNYNTYLEYHMMGSGPFMVGNYLLGQSITLLPNPNYTPIPGVPGYDHKANYTINIQWVRDPETAMLMLESGQTDFAYGLPNYYYPNLLKLETNGKISITNFPTLTISWFQFNFNINTTMLSGLGSSFHIPQYYFTNLDVRRAFVYAFNYNNYLNELIGNKVYGVNFGFHYTGIIPKGMPGYLNTSQLEEMGAIIPTYNLTLARQYLEQSGLYNVSINIPIIVQSGDPIDYAAAEQWASNLNSIDPNIQATAMYLEFNQITAYTANQNPMPIYYGSWGPDYPFPSDYVVPMYSSSGFFGGAAGWNNTTLNISGHPNQEKIINQMNQYILDGENTGNYTQALKYYDQAEVLAVNMTFYVYLIQQNQFWIYSTSIKGIQYEENPISNGDGPLVYIYLYK